MKTGTPGSSRPAIQTGGPYGLYVLAVTRRSIAPIYPFGRSEAPFGLALFVGLILAQFVALHRLFLPAGW